jgi:hypothetical protein
MQLHGLRLIFSRASANAVHGIATEGTTDKK